MLVTQPFDGEVIADLPTDDIDAVKARLDRAAQAFADRANWLAQQKPDGQQGDFQRHLPKPEHIAFIRAANAS